MNGIIEQLEKRADGQRDWLAENAPYAQADQKHMDADTPERAYWHYGYMTALRDVVRLLRENPSVTPG